VSRVPLDRIGIVLMSAVGDVVHGLPIANALKRHAPHATLTWILQPGPSTLVRGHPAIDEILLFDRQGGLAAFAAMREELQAREFDVVIALQVYFKAGVITRFMHAPVKLGFDRARARDANWLFTTHRIPARAPQHVADQYVEFLEWLGVPAEPRVWDLGPWPEERAAQHAFFASYDRPTAAIVVGTSKAEKDWLPERWAPVCDALYHDFGLQPVLVGGRSPREEAAARIILEQASAPVHSALGSGLRNLVGILDGSAVALSPDTGPLHMSVALNRPVVSLMGYTNPKRFGPHRRFGDLIVDAYGDVGEDYPATPVHRPGRMARITPERVLERVQHWHTTYRESYPPGIRIG
jgi:heptosyltransferase I